MIFKIKSELQLVPLSLTGKKEREEKCPQGDNKIFVCEHGWLIKIDNIISKKAYIFEGKGYKVHLEFRKEDTDTDNIRSCHTEKLW